jgi:hypothetical protein
LFNKENIDFRSQKTLDKHVVFENSNGEIAVTNITTRFVTTAQEVCYSIHRQIRTYL